MAHQYRAHIVSLDTAWGAFIAELLPEGVAALHFPGQLPKTAAPSSPSTATPLPKPLQRLHTKLSDEVHAYIDGRLRSFTVPLSLHTGTPFQQRVWCNLRTIPYGTTRSYGEVAEMVACRSAQAVGQACGRNPLPLLVPCHRVLAAGGKRGGFSAGLAWKERLLRHEGIAFA